MEERGYLMDLEDTFEPVVASNEKMAVDIVKDLVEPINEGLHELNKNPEVKEEKRPEIGSQRRLGAASDYGPLAEAFIR